MKKRLICITLTAIMLMSSLLFAGCSSTSDNTEIEKEATKSTMTLNMCLVTDEKTTPEAAEAVEEAFNKITKSKFKTKVNIKFYTEAEYYAAIEQTFNNKENEAALAEAANKALKKYLKDHKGEADQDALKKMFYEENPDYVKYAETTTDPLAETTAEETFYNPETGLLELKYPEADPNVVDIFFIGGYERLKEYIEKEWVSRLDDELTSGSKKLNDYISGMFLDSVKIDSGTYAIPNNRTIGQYTYMLVNKELLAKYYYNINDISDLTSCTDFLADIAYFEPNVVPIDGSPALYNVLYWSIDPDTLALDTHKFSVIGNTYAVNATLGTQQQFTSLFASKKAYRDQLLTNKLYEELGYFRSNVPANTTCAVKIVKGGAELSNIYGDKYHMITLEAPRATQETIYNSMFAVGGYTTSVERSMEIITYLNTNAALRNLLLYGIEDVNYTLNDNGQVVRTENNQYWMDINKTGNTFITYTEAGTDPDIWKYGMKQNRDATTDVLLGFTYVGTNVNTDAIRAIQTLSAATEARVNACKTYAELSTLVESLQTELATSKNNDIKDIVNPIKEDTADGKSWPYVIFYGWMTDMGFITNE